MDKTFPPISRELITALEAAFPDQVPSISDTDRQIWFKAGQVQVVRFLKEKLREQNENILNQKVTENV